MIEVTRGPEPLIVSLPHTGTDIPDDIARRLVSTERARRDTDWWVEQLYAFAADLGATLVRTPVSRTVIDVNRDPSGASLYPGQTTTALCPTETFDGAPLYRAGGAPDADEIVERRELFFKPFHDVLRGEIDRLRAANGRVVLYEAHSIRSRLPRLFDGQLANFNIGVNGGRSCDPALAVSVERACAAHPEFSRVVDGRFKGGWTTRHYGRPEAGVHALQMELAARGYMDEPEVGLGEAAWPTPYDPAHAAPMQAALRDVLAACLAFARSAPA